MILQDSFCPIFKAALTVTLPITIAASLFGLALATLTAIGRLSHRKWIQQIAAGYVWIIRGTPLLVQLFIVYFGLPNIGIVLDAWLSGILALGISFGAYASESIRGAILSVPTGQIEAAKSLGMTNRQIYQRIIIPQAIRVAVPSLMGNFIALFKQTSLVSTVTIMDMMFTAQRYVSIYFETMLIYIEVALIYLFFTSIFSWLQDKTEAHYSRHLS